MKIKFKKTDLIYISAILVVAAIEFGGFTSEKSEVTGKCDGHNYVDLGLPSGTLWATNNIGAKKSTEYGDYFAWGKQKVKEHIAKTTTHSIRTPYWNWMRLMTQPPPTGEKDGARQRSQK